MYKLLALDMDGTLLNKYGRISKENLEAINKAKAIGVKVVLATGRPLAGIDKYLDELKLKGKDDYAITYNGAVVQSTKSGNILEKNILSLEDLHYLYALSKELGLYIHAFTPEGVITPKSPSKYTILEAELNGIPVKTVDFTSLTEADSIIKVLMVEEPEKLSEGIRKIPKDAHESFTIVKSAPYFLEFLNSKVNKGYGVEVLAEKLGISSKEIICMGDAGNDLHMIRYAGLGVAMGNAFPEVKAAADYVTLTNDAHGVAHVINQFILKNQLAG